MTNTITLAAASGFETSSVVRGGTIALVNLIGFASRCQYISVAATRCWLVYNVDMEPDDDQSRALLQRQASTQSIGLTRWQSQHEGEDKDKKLLSLVEWWTKRRREKKHQYLGMKKADGDRSFTDQNLGVTSIDCCCSVALVGELKNMLQSPPSPAFDKTDDAGRNVLHLSLLRRMPKQFILLLVKHISRAELDREDSKGLRPIDYLVSLNLSD